MRRSSLLSTLAVVALVAALGSACGSSSASNTYNDADVTFASEMVPHHRQAVAMVDLTRDRDLDPAFEAFAQQVRDARQPEITEMRQWLDDWGKPVPSAADPMTGGHDDMDMGGDTDAMMTAEQMQQLAAAQDADFEALWLQMMIQHHRGAVEMADTEISDGRSPEAVKLARSISTEQTAEITQMQDLLAAP